MKSNYHERKEARIERFQALSEKNESESTRLFEHSSKLASVIPMGQPILVGHHSEAGHRSHLKKMDNAMRKGCEASDKAEYYANKAESAASNHAISSDNPDAIQLLKDKLAGLERNQELMKACNKITGNKKLSEVEKVEKLVGLGLKESTAQEIMIPVYGRTGIPSYKLTNNNAVIRNVKERIAILEKISAIPEEMVEANGVTLKISPDDNRVKIIFPGKPSDEVRKSLKMRGFHWSPSEGAWMRQISNGAIYWAKEILKSLSTTSAGFP
jgi:hypothetical protein